MNTTQLIRGLLEGCIIAIVSFEDSYGYQVVEKLRETDFENISESTVYPILKRLEKKRIFDSYRKESKLGPPRKYYKITSDGKKELKEFLMVWNSVKSKVDLITKEVK